MVGDSLEHDIAGAQNVGFATAFVRGGIHAENFKFARNEFEVEELILQLATQAGVDPPDYSLAWFR